MGSFACFPTSSWVSGVMTSVSPFGPGNTDPLSMLYQLITYLNNTLAADS